MNLAFVDVIGLLAPPTSLFRLAVLLRAFRNGGISASAQPPSAVLHAEPPGLQACKISEGGGGAR